MRLLLFIQKIWLLRKLHALCDPALLFETRWTRTGGLLNQGSQIGRLYTWKANALEEAKAFVIIQPCCRMGWPDTCSASLDTQEILSPYKNILLRLLRSRYRYTAYERFCYYLLDHLSIVLRFAYLASALCECGGFVSSWSTRLLDRLPASIPIFH